MKVWTRLPTIFAAAALLAGLAGCREDEQDRYRTYRPGVYQGKKDQSPSASARAALSVRLIAQGGVSIGTGAGDKTVGDVRPPK